MTSYNFIQRQFYLLSIISYCSEVCQCFNFYFYFIIIIEFITEKMGGEYSMHISDQKYNWRPLKCDQGVILSKHCERVEDDTTKLQADYYQITIYHDIPYYSQLVSKHKNISHKHVLQLIDATIKQKTLLDCSNADIVQVYTEVILHRFSEINAKQLQYLIILKQILEGCLLLVDLSGAYFRINQNMIGLNSQKIIKVWFNQHFGRQQIDYSNILRNQEEMIKCILDIFANRLTKRYNFFDQTTFIGLKVAIQSTIFHQTMFNNQIKCNTQTQTYNSTAGISVSDISNIDSKVKVAKIKRTSIDIKTNPFLNSQISTKKENNLKQNRQNNKAEQSQYRLSNSKDMPKSIKFSLANPLKNMENLYFVPIPNNPILNKPVVRINYENSPISINKSIILSEQSELDHSFTHFPKQESESKIIITPTRNNSVSALRSKYRKCSQITQRSEEGSEFSQYYSNKNSYLNENGNWNKMNKKSQFFDSL